MTRPGFIATVIAVAMLASPACAAAEGFGPGNATSTTISCSPNSVGLTSPSICTATVTDTDLSLPTAPGGLVSFASDATGGTFSAATCALSPTEGGGGQATCSVEYTPGQVASGQHTITASYGGDLTHATSLGTTAVMVSGATSTGVSCSSDLTRVGETISCTATVTDTDATAPTIPDGTVSFHASLTGSFSDSGSCALSPAGPDGEASCSLTYTPDHGPGPSEITASYPGDAVHAPSSGTSSVWVTRRQVSASLSCSPANVVVGQGTSCTAAVTDVSAGGPITPVGTVSFSANSASFSDSGVCTLAPTATDGRAACSVTYTPDSTTATTWICMDYGGDNWVHWADRAFTSIIVVSGPTSVSCSPEQVALGVATTCTATVTDTLASAPTPPGGSVSFSSDPGGGLFSDSASCVLAATGPAGQAACSVSYMREEGPGSQTITASYDGDSTRAPSSGSTTVLVAAERATSTSVSCSPSTVIVLQTTTCTATVIDTDDGATVTPQGSVSLSSNRAGSFAASGSCALEATGTDGHASCSLSYTPESGQGSHTITADFAGDSEHATSSGSTSIATPRRTISVSVSCVPGTVTVGHATSCMATFEDTDSGVPITPSGTAFFDRASDGSLGSCTPSPTETVGRASCSVSYTPEDEGPERETRPIFVEYFGDATHGRTFGVAYVTVVGGLTTVSCSPEALAVGASAQCTATVTDADRAETTTPNGTVLFASDSGSGSFSGTSSCALSPTGTEGKASCFVSYTALESGGQTITATYLGDVTHATSSGTTTVEVAPKRATATSVTCLAGIIVGETTTCTATVTDADAGAPSTPEGLVSFASNAVGSSGWFSSSGTCALAETGAPGQSACSVSYTPEQGQSHTIAVEYGGDDEHAASAGTVGLEARRRATSVGVSCASDTLPLGAAIGCTAIVTDTDTGTPVTPQNSVSFGESGGTDYSLGTCTLSPTATVGQASCSVTVTRNRTGPMWVVVNYLGDSVHRRAERVVVSLTVTHLPTSTSVGCSPSTVLVGAMTTCTATVTDATGTGSESVPGGTVSFSSDTSGGTFSDGGSCTLATAPSAEHASCSVSYAPKQLGSWSHAITAQYGGDDSYLASTGSVGVTVTSTSVSCSPARVPVGEATSCTATISNDAADLLPPPSGTVSFRSSTSGNASSGVGSCNLSSAGTHGAATCSVSYTPAEIGTGTHTITADYDGDVAHPTSRGTTSLTVVARPPTITINSPLANTRLSLGQIIDADFSCADTNGPGVAACTAMVDGAAIADGAPLPTDSAGTHLFTVTATGNAQTTRSVMHEYEVLAGSTTQPVSGGDTVTTDPGAVGATTSVPVQTSVNVPDDVDGTLSVSLLDASASSPSGYSFFEQEVKLSGPPASAGAPYVVTFTVDASLLGDVAPADLQVFRNGIAVAGCTNATAALPDPCVAARALGAGGDAIITVRTSAFSTWNLGALQYTISAFSAPIVAPPSVNAAEPGAAIPLRFSLGANRGPDILAIGYPRTVAYTCGGALPGPSAGSPASGTLSYDAAKDKYTYTWKTAKTIKGCVQISLRFRDGSLRTALFKFK